jgi:hypothetical protein
LVTQQTDANCALKKAMYSKKQAESSLPQKSPGWSGVAGDPTEATVQQSSWPNCSDMMFSRENSSCYQEIHGTLPLCPRIYAKSPFDYFTLCFCI